MSILKSISKIGLAPSVFVGNLITGTTGKVFKKAKFGKTTTEELASTKAGLALGVATVGVASALAVAVNPTGALNVAKSIVPKSTGGKLVAGLLAPIGVSAVISNPQSIGKSAKAVYDFESTGISIATGSTGLVQGVKDYVVEHPVASAVGAGAVGLLIAKAVAPAVAGFSQTQAIKEQTEVLREQSQGTPQQSGETTLAYPQDAVNSSSGMQAPLPLVPETGTSQGKTRRKSRSEPRRQTISQRVQVNVINNKVTKRYLNKVFIPN